MKEHFVCINLNILQEHISYVSIEKIYKSREIMWKFKAIV